MSGLRDGQEVVLDVLAHPGDAAAGIDEGLSVAGDEDAFEHHGEGDHHVVATPVLRFPVPTYAASGDDTIWEELVHAVDVVEGVVFAHGDDDGVCVD